MSNKKFNTISFVFFFLVSNLCWSQNVAPTLMATGNQPYCPKSQINIVTTFDINDPDDTQIESLFIQISTGYAQGEDTLTLTGSHPNILTSWNTTEGKLTLFGIGNTLVSYTDLIAATKEIVFQSTSNNPTNKTFSITIGDANFLPSTGHYYEYVPSIGITWTSAKVAAENRTYFGLQGYLATITSAEEAQLSGEQAAGAGWIGGSDSETEGIWKWVTGPETGTIFWNGLSNGSSPNFAFWNANEPNQFGDEDYAHVTSPNIGIPGSWNDLTNTGSPSGDYQPKGYIIEYGGLPGDPIINISASSSIYTPYIIDSMPATICGSGSVNLQATASEGEVLWFDAQTSDTPLFSGSSFITLDVNSTTTYYALASVNGCIEGVRTPVTATINPIPTITNTSNGLICESGIGTLIATASGGEINWYEAEVGGTAIFTGETFITPTLNSTTTYYIDATLNGCTTGTRTPIIATVQNTALPIANSPQSFCDIDNTTIANLTITGTNVLWYNSDVAGTPLNTNTALATRTYYTTQTVNTCESPSRLAVDVIIFETVNLPNQQDIPMLELCDTNLDGDDTNGLVETFNLTTNESFLLNGKSPTDFNFTYFTDAGYTNIINNPTSFTNIIPFGQIIYVRIENNAGTSCYVDTSFDIIVNELPVIQSNIIFKNCDEDGNPDGFTDYNLTEANAIITNNNSDGFDITYHSTMANANSGSDAVNALLFNNSTANIVYARVENNKGCYRVSTVNLEVSTTAFINEYLQELNTCDDDATIDGMHVFDLTQASDAFIDEFPTGQNLSVKYYRNLNDAQLELNEITEVNNFINETPFSQLLYVRVESDSNGDCFGLGPHLLLTVHPRPEFEVDHSAIYCLDNNPITLTTFNPKGNYSYEWKDNNGNVISNSPFAEVISGGSYTVIATSSFGCESFPVTFPVVESAVANVDINDITIVELSDNNSITINNDANNLGIGDYEFSLDNINGAYQNEPYFDRVGAGLHTIYVRDKNGCGIAPLEVFILGFPKFFTPNNDGINDTWQIKGLGTDFTNASKINIYNRYGKLVKQLNAKNDTWDGMFNGQLLPDSDYWFVAELVEITGNTKNYRGHFSLIR